MSHANAMQPLVLSLLLAALAAMPALSGSVLGDDYNQDESHDYNGMPRLRLALETGPSQWMYNPDGLSEGYHDYLNELESGWSTAAELAYFPWAKGGIGVCWIWFLSKHQDSTVQLDSGAAPHGLSDRVSVVYYGPHFLSRLQAGRFGLLVGGFSAGWLTMHNTWTDNGRFHSVKAGALAVVTNVGWEYSFYRLVSMGVNGRALLCNIKEYTYDGKKVSVAQPEDRNSWNTISMTRFELNAGIRFGL